MIDSVFQAFRPTVNKIGFYNADIEDVANACKKWLLSHGPISRMDLRESFDKSLERLFPLGELRNLLIECKEGWVAHFVDTDDRPKIWPIMQTLKCRSVIASYRPDTYDNRNHSGEMGSVMLELYEAGIVNLHAEVRTIYNINEGDRWRFGTSGNAPWWFEDVEDYKARRVRDRFTFNMLVNYLHALKIDAYSLDFYLPNGVLFQPIRDADGYWNWPEDRDPNAIRF